MSLEVFLLSGIHVNIKNTEYRTVISRHGYVVFVANLTYLFSFVT